MKSIIDIARECGARFLRLLDGGQQEVTFVGDQLTALESRIRSDERQKCAAELADMHLKQLGRATEHNYFAVASQSIGAPVAE